MIQLPDSSETKRLTISVTPDEITNFVSTAFDFEFTGETHFDVPSFAEPTDYQIGLIVGPSGTGKSTIIRSLGETPAPTWDLERAVCSHFASGQEAMERLGAVGLNSIPVWVRPYHVLSTGEKFRADVARQLVDGARIDEFTSVVDRSVAKSCSFAVQRYIRAAGLTRVIFATCHQDVEEWLQPDWVFDTASGEFAGRRFDRRPTIDIQLIKGSHKDWPYFRNHHYLSTKHNKIARCWLAVWDGVPIGFCSVLAFPSPYETMRNAWREHRTVVLPEYQGLGLGVRISDAVGEIVLKTFEGKGDRPVRYFSKTSNYRMGEYRNRSPLWKPTSKNQKTRLDYDHGRVSKESSYRLKHMHRLCYSHEYVGSQQ